MHDQFLGQRDAGREKPRGVKLLERLLEGEIKCCCAINVVQRKRFSDLLSNVITRYQTAVSRRRR